MPTLDEDVLAAIPQGTLGVALSGGGDSLALLHLLKDWGERDLRAVTVDHGLRPMSLAEAMTAGDMARSLGVQHEVLQWERDKSSTGNLQEAARLARRSLISAWAKNAGIPAVALGHTADDQAETFLMRLARGSGLDGLSAMDGIIEGNGLDWVRPMLHLRREELREYLRSRNQTWIDDPSNEDDGFERVRVRKALRALDDLGINVPKIEKTTRRLKSAKQVLYVAAKDLGHAISEMSAAGALSLNQSQLLSAQPALQLRLLSDALRYVAGSYYAPRSYMVQGVLDALHGEMAQRSLHGCLVHARNDLIHIWREPKACEGRVALGQVWDGRWMVSGPDKDLTVAALGESGLRARPEWRDAKVARDVLRTTPAVWRGDEMVAAPLLDDDCAWRAKICLRNDFFPQ